MAQGFCLCFDLNSVNAFNWKHSSSITSLFWICCETRIRAHGIKTGREINATENSLKLIKKLLKNSLSLRSHKWPNRTFKLLQFQAIEKVGESEQATDKTKYFIDFNLYCKNGKYTLYKTKETLFNFIDIWLYSYVNKNKILFEF